MFDNLSQRFQDIFKKLRGKGKLTEENITEALKEVKLSLLEADVNYKVVKEIINTVKEKAVGTDVLSGINPSAQFIKLVNDELVEVLGGTNSRLTKSVRPPSIIMLVGLNGAGKTTFAGKLAKYLQKKGEKPYLIGADVYRPAAMEQLKVLGSSINTPVFLKKESKDVFGICKEGIIQAKNYGASYIIIDTAGRLHIDDELMNEVEVLKKSCRPQEILLVVDSMTGQDAVNIAKKFNEVLNIDGVVLSKLDGDTRGGAALSIKAVVGKPIKFVSTGEKLEDIELFHPDRLVSRIFGMGDIVSLVERAQENIDEDETKKLEEKLKKQNFDLEDFLDQLKKIKKMGPISNILAMIPGANKMGDLSPAEDEMKRIEAIIYSMTPKERQNPEIINGSRKKRIANGSGTQVHNVNNLLKQFKNLKNIMKSFAGGKMPNLGGIKNMMKLPF